MGLPVMNRQGGSLIFQHHPRQQGRLDFFRCSCQLLDKGFDRFRNHDIPLVKPFQSMVADIHQSRHSHSLSDILHPPPRKHPHHRQQVAKVI